MEIHFRLSKEVIDVQMWVTSNECKMVLDHADFLVLSNKVVNQSICVTLYAPIGLFEMCR